VGKEKIHRIGGEVSGIPKRHRAILRIDSDSLGPQIVESNNSRSW